MTASPTVALGIDMNDRRSERDADFAAYLQARRASVLRTAYLLSGDLHTAEDLTQTAFAQLYLAGDYVLANEPFHSGDGSGVIAIYANAGDLLVDRVRSSQRMAS